MELLLKTFLFIGLCSTIYSVSLHTSPWTDNEVLAMALAGTEYYNKGTNEDSVFQLFGNDTDYFTDKSSVQIHFSIKETECIKSNNEVVQHCNFLEDGIVKRCMATFFPEEELPAFVINCEALQSVHSRVKRSRNSGGRGGSSRGGSNRGGSSRGSRGGGSRGRNGAGSSIAGGGSRGSSRHA
ncbi:hypothetical protein GDO86_012038 [Hymenochirus boettgeri]|uniref:Uncharacterized protein n=1 Tax=Hymenochirus boettgeri TaxID=247094 RepID=A0A8T2JIX8_9PIPI|nr:hypothetical protein GDO86_012038 [Hymenochirus boettgeri]